jgi:hypothetical protein
VNVCGSRFAASDPALPRSRVVYDYTLPEDLVPILDAVLRRVGR